jgi:hypothetical protein
LVVNDADRTLVLGGDPTINGGTHSGTNTGDQTSIVGISGTKAQFDTACSDGNFLYVGDITQYTDELAQDAVGTILADSATLDFTYDDATPSITAIVKDASITLAKQADVATSTVFYRKTAGDGAPEVQTLATLKTDLGLTGTNSGDQTSISGISGTKAQFDTACSDGNFAYTDNISDTVYGAGWNGDTTVAPSKNAVYDKMQEMAVASVQCIIDGGGAVITTGMKACIEVPFACTIERATIVADVSGSVVVDIWKDTYANYPATVADTITAAAKPTLSAAIKNQDSTLTGWTTAVAAGDWLCFNVDSATTVTRVTVSLKVRRT